MTLRRVCMAAIVAGLAQTSAPDLARAADLPIVGPFFIQKLPPRKWCRNQPPPRVVVKSVTQVQEWCDPRNRDLMQADVFVKTANGDAGEYITSHRDWPCEPPTAPPPEKRVRNKLCRP